MRRLGIMIIGVSLLGMAGCASTGPTPVAPTPTMASTTGTTLVQSGQITDIRDVAIAGQPSGVGGFLGSIAGAILGSQVGSGWGSTAASIGGSIAGGVAGNSVERSTSGRRNAEITVRLNSGETRQYAIASAEGLRIGDQVTVTTEHGVSRVTR